MAQVGDSIDLSYATVNSRRGRVGKEIAHGSDNIYYTQRNEGKFVIVESRAPNGYYGDWTDATKPGTAGSVLGKRAYGPE